jgi:hypothetical protein
MNNLKTLGTAVLAIAALLALAGPAAATNLTSPKGTTYTGTVKAEAGTIEVHGPFTTVACTKSTAEAKIENHGASITVSGKVSGLTFTGCNFPVKVLKYGSVEGHTGGTVTSSGAEITVETSIANCLFVTESTDVGSGTGGTPARLDINSAGIPRTGHSFFCGSSATATGSYTVTTPGTLFLD